MAFLAGVLLGFVSLVLLPPAFAAGYFFTVLGLLAGLWLAIGAPGRFWFFLLCLLGLWQNAAAFAPALAAGMLILLACAYILPDNDRLSQKLWALAGLLASVLLLFCLKLV